MSFVSIPDLITPYGLKLITDIVTNPKVVAQGDSNLMVTVSKTLTGGAARCEIPTLSAYGKKRCRTLLTSKRVLRGGTSIADGFLKMVSPYGFQAIQNAIKSSGGKVDTPARGKKVKVAQQSGGSWYWPFCSDSGSSTSTVDTSILRSTLPDSKSINYMPNKMASTQSVEMIKMIPVINDANTNSFNASVDGSQLASPTTLITRDVTMPLSQRVL